MKLATILTDKDGETYFSEVESDDPPGSNKERVQQSDGWLVWRTQPGHFRDWKPVATPECHVFMSGKAQVTVSTGEKRFFSRGDILVLQDTNGKGHA